MNFFQLFNSTPILQFPKEIVKRFFGVVQCSNYWKTTDATLNISIENFAWLYELHIVPCNKLTFRKVLHSCQP